MRAIEKSGVAFVAVAAAFGLAIMPAQAEDVVRFECEVEVAGEALPRAEEPLVVEATYTEALGEELSAAVAEESGIRVVSVEAAEEESNTVLLTLDTSAAAPGSWDLALRGTAGECTGQLVVTADEEDTDGR